MAYTLEQIYEALGKIENGGTMVADLQDAIRSARDDAAKNRIDKNKVLDALGLRNGDASVDDSLKNLVATLAAVKQSGNDPSTLGTQLQALQSQVSELNKKYEAAEKKAKDEHDERVRGSIRSTLVSALTKGKAIQPEQFLEILKANVVMKDNDTAIYKDGDNELSLEDGAAAWLKANPWAVKNDQRTGTGSSGGSNGKTYTLEDLKTMTPAQINEHWSEISNVKK